MSKPVHSDSHRPVSSAAIAEKSRSSRSSTPAVHYHLATPLSRVILNQPASLNRSSECAALRLEQREEEEEEVKEEEQELIQDPIIVGPINPIQPLQINFDLRMLPNGGDD